VKIFKNEEEIRELGNLFMKYDKKEGLIFNDPRIELHSGRRHIRDSNLKKN